MTAVIDRTDDAMRRHAAHRGAVNTPNGLATLIGWPTSKTARCHVITGRVGQHHARPLKAETFPVICGICGDPADWRCVEHGFRLCLDCARDEATAMT